MHLYLLGGHQRKRWLRPLHPDRRFDRALIQRFDLETGRADRMLEYQSPPEFKAHPESSDLFTSATLSGNRLFVGTYTEILIFELPQFQRIHSISSPHLNSVHHVAPTKHGTLLVVSTGLDLVLELALDGTVLREWDVLNRPLWSRFSRDIDYRKIETTKPHLSHPNFVFQLDDDIWVTRFYQKDAICLTRKQEPIRIDIERPHDGVSHDGSLYFTTVDGHLIVVDAKSLKIVSSLDLKTFRDYPFGPSWCRGVLILEKDLVCVGFTRIRKTAFMSTMNWIKHGFHHTDPPTHIALFNLAERSCLKTIDLEPAGINILFGILPADPGGTSPGKPAVWHSINESLSQERRPQTVPEPNSDRS